MNKKITIGRKWNAVKAYFPFCLIWAELDGNGVTMVIQQQFIILFVTADNSRITGPKQAENSGIDFIARLFCVN